jgi:hypothetical protein
MSDIIVSYDNKAIPMTPGKASPTLAFVSGPVENPDKITLSTSVRTAIAR